MAEAKKILIAYFSHSGNIHDIAEQIHRMVGGDIFEILAVKTYPNDYDAVVEVARQELDSGYKPDLKTKINNIDSYDSVFLGYPSWWGTFPAPVKTFLSENDFSGKKIMPFCTQEGSGLGRSVVDISKLCPKAILLDGLAIRGSQVRDSKSKLSAWLKEIKFTK